MLGTWALLASFAAYKLTEGIQMNQNSDHSINSIAMALEDNQIDSLEFNEAVIPFIMDFMEKHKETENMNDLYPFLETINQSQKDDLKAYLLNNPSDMFDIILWRDLDFLWTTGDQHPYVRLFGKSLAQWLFKWPDWSINPLLVRQLIIQFIIKDQNILNDFYIQWWYNDDKKVKSHLEAIDYLEKQTWTIHYWKFSGTFDKTKKEIKKNDINF